MLLEVMGGTSLSASQQANPNATQGTGKKKWGKKGRKLRNKDPYGCHITPEDMLGGGGSGPPVGVTGP